MEAVLKTTVLYIKFENGLELFYKYNWYDAKMPKNYSGTWTGNF